MTSRTGSKRNRAATGRGVATTHAGNEIRVSPADEYMTRNEVAARLKVAPKTLSNWHHLKKGPKCFRLAGGHYRYRTADVLAYEQGLLTASK